MSHTVFDEAQSRGRPSGPHYFSASPRAHVTTPAFALLSENQNHREEMTKIHVSKWRICVVTEDSSFPSPGSGSQGMNGIKKIILGYYCFSWARLPLLSLQDPRRPPSTKAGLYLPPEWWNGACLSWSSLDLSLGQERELSTPRVVYCFRIFLLGLPSAWAETAVNLSDANRETGWFLFSFSSTALGGKLEKFVSPAGIGNTTAITTLSFSKRRL